MGRCFCGRIRFDSPCRSYNQPSDSLTFPLLFNQTWFTRGNQGCRGDRFTPRYYRLADRPYSDHCFLHGIQFVGPLALGAFQEKAEFGSNHLHCNRLSACFGICRSVFTGSNKRYGSDRNDSRLFEGPYGCHRQRIRKNGAVQ